MKSELKLKFEEIFRATFLLDFSPKYAFKFKSIFILLLSSLFFIGCGNLSTQINRSWIARGFYGAKRIEELPFPETKVEDGTFGLVDDTIGYKRMAGGTEYSYLKFYSDKNVKGLGSETRYWRWEVSISKQELSNMLNKNVYNLSRAKPGSVFTLKNGKWISGSVQQNPIGKLQDVGVVRRGSSGIALDFLIKGSGGIYVVRRESNIRKILDFSKSSRGTSRDIELKGKNGAVISKNAVTFPSAFFSMELKGGNYIFYGGGFGHGIGLPQTAASDLASTYRYNYKNILKRYYPGASLSDIDDIVRDFSGNIRVGVTTNARSAQHDRINLKAEDGILLDSGKSTYRINPNVTVEFIRTKEGVAARLGGKPVLSSRDKIIATSSGKIAVTSIARNGSFGPKYRGKFEIKPYTGNKLLLINEINIEEYLMQVVGSEMPGSFPEEALKSQAVAARTYAMRGVLGRRYEKYGFDVDDTDLSQVYNIAPEKDEVTEAVKGTAGKILQYNGKPIDAFFYSTSSGYSASPIEVW
ncbi:MAG: SpoIID/LytB domain-containing protein [Fusobacteriaceae bacterium]